ncbi:MAG: DEAD/DEAH box helicase, partial [Planctomycetota bacterium]
MEIGPGGFAAFDLDPAVRRGLEDAGFVDPRPVQVAVLPSALGGRDVLGLARTGTGKTAAFALPILDRIARREGSPAAPQALVLAPTRELARQIVGEIERLGAHVGVRAVALIGGVRPEGQRDALSAGADVVVGTTGRVLDLVRDGALDLGAREVLVRDEADRMLEMGFLPDVRRVLERTPDRQQTMLFSATMPEEVQALAQRVLREPDIVDLG